MLLVKVVDVRSLRPLVSSRLGEEWRVRKLSCFSLFREDGTVLMDVTEKWLVDSGMLESPTKGVGYSVWVWQGRKRIVTGCVPSSAFLGMQRFSPFLYALWASDAWAPFSGPL